MAKQSQNEIDQIIQRSQYLNRDLIRRDIIQICQSSECSLILKYEGNLYLSGTVLCQYKGGRYNIPIEILLNVDHPFRSPSAFVRPTSTMIISSNNPDVQSDGTILNHYLKTWRHPHSDLCHLISSISQSFSSIPPVYSGPSSSSSVVEQSTPYPTNMSSMPMPGNSNLYSYGNMYSPSPLSMERSNVSGDVYRQSIQSAVFDRIGTHWKQLNEYEQIQIDTLQKSQQNLEEREKKIFLFINQIKEQQTLIENYLSQLKSAKSNENCFENSPKKVNNVKDDVVILPTPISKQLFESVIEEHAIEDLLYYLGDGLRRGSISLDIYLKRVRELSRRQFLLKATMIKCQQMN